MSVKLRKRKNGDGTISLLLDIYHCGKRSYEFLKNLKLNAPRSQTDRFENKERLALAERIRNKREQQLQGDQYNVTPAFMTEINFVKFFEAFKDKYTKKNKRVLVACFHKFKEFMEEAGIKSLLTKNIDESIVMHFKEYLENTLNGETPATYFQLFKKMLRAGIREKMFTDKVSIMFSTYNKELQVRHTNGIKKEILTFDEIQTLASTNITNSEVKRAFLFSCVTGLRWCDIKQLQWKNIQNGIMSLSQAKTEYPVLINLNESAINILEKKGKGDDKVFILPSHTSCLKNLKWWCKKAGIQKHITWHCARHSFGTALVFYGNDMKTAGSLLGHTGLEYVGLYVRVSDKLKEKGVNSLPAISINNGIPQRLNSPN